MPARGRLAAVTAVGQAPPGRDAPPPLRRNRDFLLLWSGAGVSFVGARVSAVAYPLIVLWHTDSPLAMSAVSFAALLPVLLVQLPAGALTDRWNRRRLMITCEAGRALVLGSVAVALALGFVSVAHLAAVAFVDTSLAVFYKLAERGAVRNVVHPAHLGQALSQNEARSRAAGLIGQPGGVLLQTAARWAPFSFAALASLISLLTLLLIKKEFQGERAPRRKLTAEVLDGLRWLWWQRFLRGALVFVALSNILFQVLALTLIVVVKEENRSPATLAVIVGIGGIGGVAGALTGGWWLRRLTQRATLLGGASAWAVLMSAMAFTRNPVVLGVLFAATGFVGAIFNVTAAVYQVRVTPDALQGRVAAAMNIVGSGTNTLGALVGGVLLTTWGGGATLHTVGAAMAVLALACALSPALRTEDRAAGVPRSEESGQG
ncbi:putative MFS family arabinose efflux permease [Micromonospora sp. A202]|uniref:MFS transporter n=1 Tax=Micromonospora sp. A202 TaxID=2572899 RepID=UPI00116E5F1B|nr:MFS transporter [Micromonospora sp. A202]TQJ23647.1 putative MFS family arabinose efflux permease [Micromonospora sp. A202]